MLGVSEIIYDESYISCCHESLEMLLCEGEGEGEGEDKGESGSDDDEVKLKKLKIMSIESMI